MKAYQQLEQHYGRCGRLRAACGVLEWDLETMMPPGGAESRGEQLAALKTVIHELERAAALEELLEHAAGEAEELDEWRRANLREMRRMYQHQRAVPTELVEELTRATTACTMVWREARPAGAYQQVRPHLAQIVGLVRSIAQSKAEALGCSAYDALLDEWQPGLRVERVDDLFSALEQALPPLIERAISRQQGTALLPLGGPFRLEAQRELALQLMRTLGIDFDHVRLDTSAHPFCSGGAGDLRITTRYDEANPMRSIMAVIHESGHALYELGLPRRWRYQPVGEARGMAAHESQSLLFEMQACRSDGFLRWLTPMLRQAFGGTGEAWSYDNVRRHYRRVERSFIRVDADEVTYPAHVVLRYRLERELIEGTLSLDDLPEAWAAGLKALLGIEPANDAEGCLQDIHWVQGVFGYFPTYTLGALAAAQLFRAAGERVSGLEEALARGDFAPLCAWLRENVHERASLLTLDELLEQATGAALSPHAFLTQLEARYLSD